MDKIEWEAPEYDHFEKDADWFWAVGGITAVLVLLMILLKNFLFAIILVLGAFTVMLYGARPPELIYFALTPKGFRIKDRLYPYDHLHSFWVSDEPHRRKIIFESDRFFLPHIIIPLPTAYQPEQVREYLLKYLKEVRQDETLTDIIVDTVGF